MRLKSTLIASAAVVAMGVVSGAQAGTLEDVQNRGTLRCVVSTGIAGLNIGDDANSLQQSAANALRRAQQQGGNRSQAYSSWSQPAQPNQPRAEGPVA